MCQPFGRGWQGPRNGLTDCLETWTNERCTCGKAIHGSSDHEHRCPLRSVNPRALVITELLFQVSLCASQAVQAAAMTPPGALHRWRAATGMPTAIQAPPGTPGAAGAHRASQPAPNARHWYRERPRPGRYAPSPLPRRAASGAGGAVAGRLELKNAI
jgi:hypothetical protein